MNSFYGQMRWGEKFEQFFYEFRITNHPFSVENEFNKDHEKDGLLETLATSEEVFIQPNEDFAIFNINTANYWIGIIPVDSKGDDKPKNTQAGFSLFHQSPNIGDSLKVQTILPTKPEDLEVSMDKVEQLNSGDILRIINGKYDKAGHFTSEEDAEKVYFKLPEQIIRIDNTKDLVLKENDQKFHFNKDPLNLITLEITGDNDSLIFTHAKPFTDKTVPEEMLSFEFICNMDNSYPPIPPGENRLLPTVERKLEPGDFICTQELTFDQGGHLTNYKNVYYQLPYSDIDERLDLIEVAITELQNDLKGVKKDIEDIEKQIDTLNKNLSRIGDQDQFDNLKPALERLTGIAIDDNFTLAYGLEITATHSNTLQQEHAGIYSIFSHICAFIKGKHSDFVIPNGL